MRKLLKSKKALSPVIAAIILIAVTVAVSIAVAAWMGALTFTFMKTEELRIISVTFPTNQAVITVTNTGPNALTITSATVDDALQGTIAYGGAIGTDGTLGKGGTGTVTISGWNWVSGYKYTFAVLTAAGNKYTYTTTAAP